jgi:hypothetical protein
LWIISGPYWIPAIQSTHVIQMMMSAVKSSDCPKVAGCRSEFCVQESHYWTPQAVRNLGKGCVEKEPQSWAPMTHA